MQKKTTLRYYPISIRIAKAKLTISNAGKGMEIKELLFIASVNAKW